MLDRVRQAIANGGVACLFGAQMMLPEPALPDSVFSARHMALAARDMWHLTRKPRLDDAPTRGIVEITFGQGPDRMNVVGQHDPCIDKKRAFRHGLAHGMAKRIDVIGQQGLPASTEFDGKEYRRPCDPWPDVV